MHGCPSFAVSLDHEMTNDILLNRLHLMKLYIMNLVKIYIIISLPRESFLKLGDLDLIK
jgi:hypothetical protein